MVTSSVSCIMHRPLLALAEEGYLSPKAERQSERQGDWDRYRDRNRVRNGGLETFCLFVLMFRF